jgi:hypothetical protein
MKRDQGVETSGTADLGIDTSRGAFSGIVDGSNAASRPIGSSGQQPARRSGVRSARRRDQADLQASKRIEFALDGLGNAESEVAERRSIGLAARSCVE